MYTASSGKSKVQEWEVESALHCLTEAKKIEANTKLMEKVRELAKQRMLSMGAVAAKDADD